MAKNPFAHIDVDDRPTAEEPATPIKHTTHYVIVLDASGSMEHVAEETRKGVNEQIQEMRKQSDAHPEQEFLTTLVLFSGPNDIHTVFEARKAADVKELTPEDYKTGGMTALYDAMHFAADGLKKILPSDYMDRGNLNVIFTVFTDGEENSSHAHTQKDIQKLCSDLKETKCWAINYIGTNHDVEKAAAGLGIAKGNTMSYTGSVIGTQSAFRRMTDRLATYSGQVARSVELNDVSIRDRAMASYMADDGNAVNLAEDGTTAPSTATQPGDGQAVIMGTNPLLTAKRPRATTEQLKSIKRTYKPNKAK